MPRTTAPEALAPSDLRALAPFLLATGLALCLAGWGDLALLMWPPRFGDNEWEFGVVAQVVDALPLPTMGILLLALAAKAAGGRRAWPRMLAAGLAFAALVLVVLLVLFLLDIPVALRALRDAQQAAGTQGAPLNPMIGSGIRRGVAKVLTFGSGYIAAWAAMAVSLWRGAKRDPR